MATRSGARGAAGVLLMEALLALTILTAGLLAALEALRASSEAIRRATELSGRTQCAQEKLLEAVVGQPVESGACSGHNEEGARALASL